MTNQETIANLNMIRVSFVDPATKEQMKLIYDTFDNAIKALEQEPCKDAISRQKALLSLTGEDLPKDRDKYIALVNERIKALPPVNPQEPKTGHWIQTNESFINQDGQFIYNFICSECKSLSYFRKSNKKVIGANVCPNCGAKMIEPQESGVNNG